MDEQKGEQKKDGTNFSFSVGNGIREKAIELLGDLQGFQIQIFDRSKKKLSCFENRFSKIYADFLDFDENAGLYCERIERSWKLDDHIFLAIRIFQISGQRETLRNLLRDVENRINNHRGALNNRDTLFIAKAALAVAVISLIPTISSLFLWVINLLDCFFLKLSFYF